MATSGYSSTNYRGGSSRSYRSSSAEMDGNGWGSGRMWGAVAAGVAVGLAANFGRKLAVQAVSGVSGDWFDALKTEHRMTLKIFDKIEQTRDDQTAKRTMLLTQLKHALSKHALEEEDVIYPALRDADQKAAADKLNHDHGYVKTYLYELLNMPKDDPQWLARVREFRLLIEEHVREEEEEIYPSFRAKMSKEENSRLTLLLHKEGLALA